MNPNYQQCGKHGCNKPAVEEGWKGSLKVFACREHANEIEDVFGNSHAPAPTREAALDKIGGEYKAMQKSIDQILDLSVEVLQLSMRSMNSLSRLGVHDLRGLVANTPDQLSAVGFGVTSVSEIEKILKIFSLSLQGTVR